MAKIGIFYGSTTGYTADAAAHIAKALGLDMADVHDVANTAPSALGDYDVIILGSSTWGSGELQDDMADFLDGAEQLYLKGKKVAIFGVGDETHGDTFCAAVGQIYRRMLKTETEMIAPFNADGYDAADSQAKVDGRWVGLVLDETNHPDLTAPRIAAWATEIASSL